MQKILYEILIGGSVEKDFIIDLKSFNVVAENVAEAITKVKLEAGEIITSVSIIDTIDIV